jgi:glycosyltransferase involved in cell wall biosynthesis
MKILLIISSLRGGGAERVMSTLANKWVTNNHKVHLISIDDGKSDFYKLDPRVSRRYLNQAKESSNIIHGFILNIKRIISLRRITSAISPDIVLSFLDSTNIISGLALVGTRFPLIVSERTDPFVRSIGIFRSLIRPFIYRNFANKVVLQTQQVAIKCQNRWRLNNLCVLPNPVSNFTKVQSDSSSIKILLSVGSLYRGKGFDTLISAFSRIAFEYPEWILRIIGAGPEEVALKMLIMDYELVARVEMPGALTNVLDEYQKAEIFCIASRHEGFPNVLLEAIASGCACIATDCESGPRDILENGRLGILTPVNDVEALVDALKTLMKSPELRKQYGSHSQYVQEKYHIEKISQQWLRLFSEAQK